LSYGAVHQTLSLNQLQHLGETLIRSLCFLCDPCALCG